MTEQTLSVAAPPAPPLLDQDESVAGDNRKKLAIVGALVAVLVGLIAAFFLMKGGGSSDTAATPTTPAPAGATTGTPADAGSSTGQGGGKATAEHPVKLPKKFHGSIGRDPFKPLYVEPVAKAPKATPGDSTGTTGDTTGAGVPVPGGDTGGTPVTVPTDNGGGTPNPTPSTPPTTLGGQYDPVWVALVKVHGTKTATLAVGYSNGTKSKTLMFDDIAAPKDTLRTVFARVFSLLSIQDGTVTVQFGDGTPFDLSPGYAHRHFVG